MNVNVDISQIVNQIRKEERQKALQEVQAMLVKRETPSEKIMRHLNNRLESLEKNPAYRYQMQNAIAVILRRGLGVRRVEYFQEEHVMSAEMIIDNIWGLLKTVQRYGLFSSEDL